MPRRTAFIYGDQMSRHTLAESHPMRPERLRYAFELLDAYGAFASDDSLLVAPRAATPSRSALARATKLLAQAAGMRQMWAAVAHCPGVSSKTLRCA